MPWITNDDFKTCRLNFSRFADTEVALSRCGDGVLKLFPTVKRSNSVDVVRMKPHVGNVTSVIGVHDGTSYVGMFQPERMAKFVCSNPKEVCAT